MNKIKNMEKEELKAKILSCYKENSGVWRAQSAFVALTALIIAMLPYYILMFGQATYFSLYWGYWVIVVFADIALFTAFVMFSITGMVYTAIQQLRGHETSFFSMFFPFRKFGDFLILWLAPFWLTILFTMLPPFIFIGLDIDAFLCFLCSIFSAIYGFRWTFSSWRKIISNLTIFCDTKYSIHSEKNIRADDILPIATLSFLIEWVRKTGVLWAFPFMLMLCYFNLELSILMIGHDHITTPFNDSTFWIGPPVMPSLASGLLVGFVVGLLARMPYLALGLSLNYCESDKSNEFPKIIAKPCLKKRIQIYAKNIVFVLLTAILVHVAVNMPIKGMRPLQLALNAKNYRLAHILLHLGANPDGNDLYGFPPFSDVAGNDDLNGAQLLFSHGASTKRIAGYLSYWIRNCSPEIKALFKQYGIEPHIDTINE